MRSRRLPLLSLAVDAGGISKGAASGAKSVDVVVIGGDDDGGAGVAAAGDDDKGKGDAKRTDAAEDATGWSALNPSV